MTPAQKTAKAHDLIAQGHKLLAEAALEATAPAPSTTAYTSASSGPFPPGKSRDWTRRNLPKIPGAYRVGQAWCCSTVDFMTWARARDLARVRAEVGAAPADHGLDLKAILAAGLAEAGIRKAG